VGAAIVSAWRAYLQSGHEWGHGPKIHSESGPKASEAMRVLDEIGAEAPGVANDLFRNALSGGWLRTWRVFDDLEMGAMSPDMEKMNEPAIRVTYNGWFSALLEGLAIDESLVIAECPNFGSLPKVLRIRKDLELLGCEGWDGIIPEDAVIGGKITTEAQSEGVSLAEWRKTNPDESGGGHAGKP
jgi:hypothetical protein